MEQKKQISALRMARISRGLPLREISKQLGVSITTIHSWETGKTYPNIDHAFMLSNFYGLQIKELFPDLFLQKTMN